MSNSGSTLISAADDPEIAEKARDKRVSFKRKTHEEGDAPKIPRIIRQRHASAPVQTPAETANTSQKTSRSKSNAAATNSTPSTTESPTSQTPTLTTSTGEEERQRLNAAHLLARAMQDGVQASEKAELLDDSDEPPLHKRFKSYIGVDYGSTLRQIEEEVRAENPGLPLPTVHTKARAELKDRERKSTRLQWQKNEPDTAILATLRKSDDPETVAVVEQFEDLHATLNSSTPADLLQQQSVTDIRRQCKKRSRATKKKVEAQANSLLLGVPVSAPAAPAVSEAAVVEDDAAPLEYTITSRARIAEPVNTVARVTETPAGLAVEHNVLGDVIPTGVYALSQFGACYAASKSRSLASVANDATNFLKRFHATSVDAFLKVLNAAPADAMLTSKGERPSGSLATDLRRILEDNDYDTSALSNERLLKFQSLWSQTHTPEQADVESALALRAIKIDRDKACEVMRSIGISQEDIELTLTHARRAEINAFLRAVTASLVTDSFLRAEEQAEVETSLSKRVKDAIKRGKKEAAGANPNSTTGRRGAEALGMTTDGFKVPTAKTLGVSMEVVDRAYLQSFMRPKLVDGEEDCVRGHKCVCFTMAQSFPEATTADSGKGSGFVAMQFLLPSELNTFKTHGQLPELRKMCVLCDRATVTDAVFENQNRGVEPVMPLHGYCVKKDVPGGYRSTMLLQPLAAHTRLTGVVGPFPAFSPANLVYSKMLVDGRLVNCIIETEVADFRMGSAGIQRT